MNSPPVIRIKRIYESASDDDGYRILVDRLWPRGVSKQDARIDHWAKEVAPSTELRKWFDHDPGKFAAFVAKYRKLLDTSGAAQQLLADVDRPVITLLYAARDAKYNHAAVLRDYLAELSTRS